MEKRALCFRTAMYGGEYAKRDKVRYEVNISVWQNGRPASHPYYVVRQGEENTDWISTEQVRRFKEVEDAKQFCQDMYEGKVDLAALKAEVDAENVKID